MTVTWTVTWTDCSLLTIVGLGFLHIDLGKALLIAALTQNTISSEGGLRRESNWAEELIVPLFSNKCSVLSCESSMLAPQVYFVSLIISLSVTMMKYHRSTFMAINTFTEMCLNLELLGNYTKTP